MHYTQFIDGAFADGTGEAIFEVMSPSSAEALGCYKHASADDVRRAVTSASNALPAWKQTGAVQRSVILRKTADEIRAGRDALARQITLELGKPYAEAQKEVDVAAEMFEWAAEEARRLYGRVIPARTRGIVQVAQLEPMGVVGAFSGWNAPAITPSRKISAALAAGCTIVIKPSEETAGVALILAQAAQRAGVPAGVLNMVFGHPAGIADMLCTAPEVAMITFTGGTAVGKELAAKAAAHMKRATLELGGHAPVVVWHDVDLDRVAASCVATKYRNAGQVCTSPTRFLVHESIYAEFSRKFAQAARALKVGDPFDPATQVGPLKNARRLAAIEALVQDAKAKGAEVLCGGRRIDAPGYYYEPTALGVRDLAADACHIEPFGPIALMMPVRDADEALREANRLPFGLAAYAFTQDMRLAHRFADEIESGVVCVNELQASLPETPFGGYKDSGLGSEGGTEGMREFLRTKCVRQGGLA
ncbi:NAD-dependent succinate-semialdehyde dehydrogenase [Bordetella sp. 2513F-2]